MPIPFGNQRNYFVRIAENYISLKTILEITDIGNYMKGSIHFNLDFAYGMLLAAFVGFIVYVGVVQHDHFEQEKMQLELTINNLNERIYSYQIQEQQKEAIVERYKKLKEQREYFLRQVRCLADNIYYEAGFEPYQGQLAVAQVVLNRIKSHDYPHTVCGVVYQPYQFTWTLHKQPRKNWRVYRKVYRLAENVLVRRVRSPIIGRDVLFYHAVYDNPSWAQNVTPVAEIGNHVFYK